MIRVKELGMFKTLLAKTLYDKRWFVFGWSIGLIAMASITIAFFPTIKDQIGTLFANVPKALESITGSTEDYKNIAGYIGTGVFDLRIPMIAITMAIILGLNISASEESSGKIYQLLAQPLSRTKIVLHKWMAMLLIFLLTHAALFLSILITTTLIDEVVALPKVLAGTLMCFLLTSAVGSLCLALGFATGQKGLATLIVTSYTFGSYLLTSFAAQVDWLKNIEPVSIFHYYKASAAIKHGLEIPHIAVLVLASIVVLVIGVIMFNKRDIGTHGA